MHGRVSVLNRGRLTIFAAAILLPAGALSVRNRMLSLVPPRNDTTEGLLTRLEADTDDSVEAQYELERRAGGKDIRMWRDVLKTQGPHARYLAADAITKTRLPEGGPVLAGLLTDYASRVRTCAVESLGAGDYKEAVPTLVAALADEDTWVRESAVAQLSIRRDPKTVPALIQAIHDTDRATASQATGALQKITGKPYRASFTATRQEFSKAVARWDAWWEVARPGWPVDASLSSVHPIVPTRVGPPAPDFSVQTVGSQSSAFRLSDKRGKVVFVSFFGAECGPCIAESADVQKIYSEFSPKGLELIGLEIGAEKPDDLRKFADWMKVSYPMAMAPSHAARDYGHIHDVPVSFLIDRKGRIRYQWNGQRDYETFSSAITRMVAEK